MRWGGEGYFDSNCGLRAVGDAAFAAGHGRAAARRAAQRLLYDVEPRHAPPQSLALRFDASGGLHRFAPPPVRTLPRTLWRVQRRTRSEREARALASFEDAPFYARSLIEHTLSGEVVRSVHESLDLDRFARPIVRAMLPFRMPRWS